MLSASVIIIITYISDLLSVDVCVFHQLYRCDFLEDDLNSQRKRNNIPDSRNSCDHIEESERLDGQSADLSSSSTQNSHNRK